MRARGHGEPISVKGGHSKTVFVIAAASIVFLIVGYTIGRISSQTTSSSAPIYKPEVVTVREPLDSAFRVISPIDIGFSPSGLYSMFDFRLYPNAPIGASRVVVGMRTGYYPIWFDKRWEVFGVALPTQLCEEAYAEPACRDYKKNGGWIRVWLEHMPSD